LRGITLDLTPLRVSRDFRLVWAGTFVSEFGYQFTRVALYVQVWELTRSTVAVGFLGLTGLLGQVAGALVGGTFIDARDRRLILVWSQVALAGVTGVLLASTLLERPPPAMLYAANTAAWFVGAIEGPARSAMVPRLVGKDLVPAALALSQVLWQTVQIVGPAIAGVLIDLTGFGAAYLIDLVSYGALFVAAFLMRPMPPEVESGEDPVGLAASLEGFRYVARHRLLQSTFVIDLVAMIFGMPAALFPALALSQFDRGTAVVGLLFAAPSVGALVQALVGGWVGRIRRQGEAVVWAVIGWGAAIAAFGLVGDRLWLALVFLALAGAADVVSAIFRSTILQVTVPDHLRGRLSGIFMLVVAGGPKLGDLEAGLVAAAFSPTVSVISGGLLCIVGAGVTAGVYPELRRYRSDQGVRPPASEAEVEGRAEGEP
jgi:MFS family permease